MARATIALLLPAALKALQLTSASAPASVRSPSSELAGWRLASRFASGCAPGGVPRRRSTLRDGLPPARRCAETDFAASEAAPGTLPRVLHSFLSFALAFPIACFCPFKNRLKIIEESFRGVPIASKWTFKMV